MNIHLHAKSFKTALFIILRPKECVFPVSRPTSGVAGHTPIRLGVKSIFRGKKIKKAKKLKKAIKNGPKGG